MQLSPVASAEDATIIDATISPDGRWVAYTGSSSPAAHFIWVRRLDATESQPAGNRRRHLTLLVARQPVLVACFAGPKLLKVEIPDGTAQPVCDALQGERGTWGADGPSCSGSRLPVHSPRAGIRRHRHR
jgi:hypothetical protein